MEKKTVSNSKFKEKTYSKAFRLINSLIETLIAIIISFAFLLFISSIITESTNIARIFFILSFSSALLIFIIFTSVNLFFKKKKRLYKLIEQKIKKQEQDLFDKIQKSMGVSNSSEVKE